MCEDCEVDEGGSGEGRAEGSLHDPAAGVPHSWLQPPGIHWPARVPFRYVYTLQSRCWHGREGRSLQSCITFPFSKQVWSRGSWADGTCRNTPGKRTMLAFVILEAAVDLNLITSVPWLKSWHLRGVSCLPALRSTAAGEVAWRCTQSLGSEPGTDSFFILTFFTFFLKFFKCHQFLLELILLLSGLVVTTGRSWSLRPVVPCAPPCPHLTAGVSPKATLTWCSRRRPPPRSSWRRSLTRPTRATELPSEAPTGGVWEGILTHSLKFTYQKDWDAEVLSVFLGSFFFTV